MTRSATPKRDKWLHLKVSLEERDLLKQIAKKRDITVADLVRESIGHRPEGLPRRDRRPVHHADPLLLTALGRIGNNLNQVGRWANTYKSSADAVQVLAALSAIDRSLKELVPPKRERNKTAVQEDESDVGSAI